MKPRSILAALYVSFLTFSILSLFFGETGVAAQEKLNNRRRALSANMADLEGRKEVLRSMLSSLMSDPEAVMVEARALGLYRRGDVVVHFDRNTDLRERLDAGQVLRLSPVRRTDEAFLRILSLAAGLIVVLVSLLAWRMNDAQTQK